MMIRATMSNLADAPEAVADQLTVDERTSPFGLFNFAESYRKAADILAFERPESMRPFDAPVRYLFYHSIELYLKAFLRSDGLTVRQMMKLSHGFSALRDVCTTRGLWLADEDRDVLAQIGAEYNYIRARYIRTGFFRGATIEALSRTGASLVETVGGRLREPGIAIRDVAPSRWSPS